VDLDKDQFPQPAWPDKPHKIGQSLCHWFRKQSHQGFARIIERLPPNPVYVEFGTFLGAGTTLFALNLRKDLQAICLDHWGITARIAGPHRPANPKDKRGRRCAFLRGEGTSLEHCQNNLWRFRDRVKLIQMKTTHQTVDALANSGVKPDCVLLDDDHNHKPFVTRLYRCRYRWPTAVVVCDDYNPTWPGVVAGVEEAYTKGFYTKDESELLGGGMIAFKRKIDGK